MALCVGDVRSILLADWDPIGVRYLDGFDYANDTEYDAYALQIYNKLISGCDINDLQAYIKWAEEYMGLEPNLQRGAAVACKLAALRNS